MPEPESVSLIAPTAFPVFQPQYADGNGLHRLVADLKTLLLFQSKLHPVASMAALEVAIPELGSVLEPHTG